MECVEFIEFVKFLEFFKFVKLKVHKSSCFRHPSAIENGLRPRGGEGLGLRPRRGGEEKENQVTRATNRAPSQYFVFIMIIYLLINSVIKYS